MVSRFTVAVVGTDNIGKSSLIISWVTNAYNNGQYIPYIPDIYEANVMVDGKPVALKIADTSSKNQFNDLRLQTYSSADSFVICYDITNIDSFDDIKTKWIPEIKYYAPNKPYILVALKIDLRLDENLNHNNYIDAKQGRAFAQEIEACAFLESTSLTMNGDLKDIFPESVRQIWRKSYNILRQGYKFKQVPVMQTSFLNQEKQMLSIVGYIKTICNQNIALNDIINIISKFLISEKRLYFEQPIEDKTSKMFVDKTRLSKHWWVMFWMDFIVILIHSICFIVFSFVIYEQINNILSTFSLLFSWLELLIVIICYGLLLFHDKIIYYSDVIYPMHMIIELCVILPNIIIQIIYIYKYPKEQRNNYAMYICIVINILSGLYKITFMNVGWPYENKTVYEDYYILCIISHSIIWILCLAPSILIIAIYFINVNYSLSVALIVLASLTICCIPCCVFVEFFCAVRRRKRR